MSKSTPWAGIKRQLADKFQQSLDGMLIATLNPTIKPNICDWASENVNLPGTMARPGLYDPDFAPYQREILNVVHDDEIDEFVLLMGSQTGKTQCILIILSYWLVNNPSLIKFLLPGSDLGRDVSADRVAPMIDCCKALKVLSSPQERRDGKNSTLRKEFTNGAVLTVGNTALPRDVTSTPSRFGIIDEYSKAIDNPNPNGDAVSLLRQRQETFYDKKLGISSTPLDEDTCLITKEYDDTDKRIWENQCLKCGEFFQPTFKEVILSEDRQSAVIRCPCCGFDHDDLAHKRFVRVGRWRRTNPDRKRRAGFFINSFSSPFTSLDAFARDWHAAQGDQDKLKQIVNEKLCETWSIAGQKHDDDVHERAEFYDKDRLPDNVLYITVGGDVQADRLEAVVKGWGEQNECYHIERLIVQGSIESNDTQDIMANLIRYPYRRADGARIRALKVFWDTGYLPEAVKRFCDRFKRYNFVPIKGRDTGEAVPDKKTYKGADKSQPLNVSKIKEWEFNALKTKIDPDKEINPGAVHFSRDCDSEYFTQLCSEVPVYEKKAGVKKLIWKKVHQRNEVWDCSIYATAGHWALPYATSKVMVQKLKKEIELLRDKLQLTTTEPEIVEVVDVEPDPEPEKPHRAVLPEKKKSSYAEKMARMGRPPKHQRQTRF